MRFIKKGGVFVPMGGSARSITYGPTASLPSSGTGNDKDVYFAEDGAKKVYQKLSGVWTDVTWDQSVGFTKSAASVAFNQFVPTSTEDNTSLTLSTLAGTVVISFYDSGIGGGYGGDINIDIASFLDLSTQFAEIASQLNTTFSSIVTAGWDGSWLSIASLDAGAGATVEWSSNLLIMDGDASGIVYGADGVADNGPKTIRTAVAGKRHFIISAYLDSPGEFEAGSSYEISLGAKVILQATLTYPNPGFFNALGLTALAMLSDVNAAVTAVQLSDIGPGESRALQAHGYTLAD